ncbi:MAG TPA: SLC13 family permease [Cerasibacillus sp.]|uniref:SLC13 family permease n=1 Tax=Cerasibacillus sp. TaxID=2498711 RepID=UPI002F3E3DFF
MNTDMLTTFLTLGIATAFFIHGKIRSDLIAIGALLVLIIADIITPNEALSGFSNSVVVMIAGLFIVGAGIFNTGLAKMLGNQLLKLGGNHEGRLLVIIMVTVGVFSAFMSNTGTVAVLLPVVMSMAVSLKTSPSKLLIPLAFASSLGGVLTMIGTPPNLVVNGLLKEHGYEPLHFFGFTPVGLVAFITGILFMTWIGQRMLPNHQHMQQQMNEEQTGQELVGIYNINHLLYLIEVPDTSPIIGKSLIGLDLTGRFDVTVISFERKESDGLQLFGNGAHVVVPKTHTTFQAGDQVLVFGQAEAMIKEYGLRDITERTEVKERFLSREFGLTEILIAPQSKFKNKTLRDIHFRKKYRCNVLALNLNGYYILKDAAKQCLRPGDALLVYGKWDDMEMLSEMIDDVVVVGKVSQKATTAIARGKAPIAGAIMLLMLLLMTFEWLDPVVTVLLSAFLMIVTGCVRSTSDAYRTINWESVFLIAAMLPMATALEKTGGVLVVSEALLNILGDYGPYAVLTGFYLLTMTLSQFISNTATAVLFAPIAMTTAVSLGVSPYPFVIAVAISASMAFATPVASPTNALVMNAGGYTFKDFAKIGVVLQLVLTVVMIIAIPFFFPF